MFEDDFVRKEDKEFEIAGRKFSYRPVTAGDEIDWLPEYMEKKTKIEDNQTKTYYEQNLGKINQCKLRNITKVPYTEETIEEVIGQKKEWKNLTNDEKDIFFRQLNPEVYSQIIEKINEIDKKKVK